LWINEWGWNSADEEAKASAVTTVLSGLKSSNYSYVLSATYLALSDLPGTPDTGHGWGLMSQNTTAEELSPRPSYVAFQDFVKQ